MAKRKMDLDTNEAPAAEESAANDNSGLRAEYDKIKAAQAKDIAEQKRQKQINDIVYERGLNAEQRTDKLVDELKLSYSEAAEAMKDKPNEDQYGNVTMKPGVSQAERQAVAKNIRMYEGVLKKLADKLGITHVEHVTERRSNGQAEGHTPF